MTYFAQKQQQINAFVLRANPLLGDNPLFYDGHFITGQLTQPHILFVSVNPGHSNREDWDDIATRRAQTKQQEFTPQPIKYIADGERGSRYANRIIDIVCAGKVENLRQCAETSFVSYFAAPKESLLQAQLACLPSALQEAHDTLSRLDIEQIRPNHIVCIGWRAFDRFIEHYGEGQAIKYERLALMGQETPYYAHTFVAGIHVHGVRHLCTKLTLPMRQSLSERFALIWQESAVRQ